MRNPLKIREDFMNAPLPATLPATAAAAPEILGDYWPGIQIYYPPVKYAP